MAHKKTERRTRKEGQVESCTKELTHKAGVNFAVLCIVDNLRDFWLRSSSTCATIPSDRHQSHIAICSNDVLVTEWSLFPLSRVGISTQIKAVSVVAFGSVSKPDHQSVSKGSKGKLLGTSEKDTVVQVSTFNFWSRFPWDGWHALRAETWKGDGSRLTSASLSSNAWLTVPVQPTT